MASSSLAQQPCTAEVQTFVTCMGGQREVAASTADAGLSRMTAPGHELAGGNALPQVQRIALALPVCGLISVKVPVLSQKIRQQL